MILTAPDASALAASLESWEWAEYAACALVALGCIGEFIAEFTGWWTGGIEERKHRLAKLSTLLLISALAFELVCLVKTNSISGLLIGSLSDKAGEADTKAQSAIEKSSVAENQSNEAKNKAEAATKLADALEEQVLELGPRDLMLSGNRAETLVKALSQFKGQKIQIRRCVFSNSEVLDTANRLVALFELAKWTVSPRSPDWGESNCLMPPNSAYDSGIWVGTPSARPNGITKERVDRLLRLLRKVPLAATLHSVRPDTGRAESGKSIEQRYDDSDSIVLVVLAHSFEKSNPAFHTTGAIVP